MYRPKRLRYLLTCFILLINGCYPGISNWVRSDKSDYTRDLTYKRCVSTHVWGKGFQEGTSGQRDYGYNSDQMVWDCMANQGYAWVPTDGLKSLTKEGSSEEERLSDYTACFQDNPSYYNWRGQTQTQSIHNLASCLERRGYRWKTAR